MPTLTPQIPAPQLPHIECGSCQQKLPLRLTVGNELATVWQCAKCEIPFVAYCVESTLAENASLIRLSKRSFDVSGQPDISLSKRKKAIQLSSRPVSLSHLEQRRSKRVDQSLVVPAVKLGPGFVPYEEPFRIMVANLSREGVGLVHDGPLDCEYIAIEFSPTSTSPIQVIVRLVRQQELTTPFHEIGGVFFVRLGSIATH